MQISDELGIYVHEQTGDLVIYDYCSEDATAVRREDAAKLASVLLRYVMTGKIGN